MYSVGPRLVFAGLLFIVAACGSGPGGSQANTPLSTRSTAPSATTSPLRPVVSTSDARAGDGTPELLAAAKLDGRSQEQVGALRLALPGWSVKSAKASESASDSIAGQIVEVELRNSSGTTMRAVFERYTRPAEMVPLLGTSEPSVDGHFVVSGTSPRMTSLALVRSDGRYVFLRSTGKPLIVGEPQPSRDETLAVPVENLKSIAEQVVPAADH